MKPVPPDRADPDNFTTPSGIPGGFFVFTPVFIPVRSPTSASHSAVRWRGDTQMREFAVAVNSAETRAYNADQIVIWADRIAEGRDEFPSALGEPDHTLLADSVRDRLRNRLIRHIALTIANRLGRENEE